MKSSFSRVLLGAAALGLLGLTATPASAQEIACTDPPTVITSSTSLTQNLFCDNSPALILRGPVTLNMRGREVRCNSNLNDGIVLEDERARLNGPGLIRNCDEGVKLEGMGRHRVESGVVVETSAVGVRASSPSNVIEGNTFERNAIGVFVDSGDNNRILRNIFQRNGQGIVDAGNGGRMTSNFVDNSDFGISTGIGDGPNLVGNEVDDAGMRGIEVLLSSDGVLNGNTVTDSERGIFLGDDTLGEAVGYRVVRSNAPNNGVDIVDAHGDCDSNTFRRNSFSEAFPACIQ